MEEENRRGMERERLRRGLEKENRREMQEECKNWRKKVWGVQRRKKKCEGYGRRRVGGVRKGKENEECLEDSGRAMDDENGRNMEKESNEEINQVNYEKKKVSRI